MTEQPDLVVLGGGSGGYAAALRAAQLGLRVTLVEKGKLGGTCLHRGCIPTKAILHAAEVADAARHGSRFGIHATLDRVDAQEITAYADSVVTRLFKGLTGLVKSRGITVVQGEGRLEAVDGTVGVRVADELITAPATVLASGSAARSLPGVTVDGTRVLTSEHALRLETLPTRAVVLGGGVIGAEFASAWTSLGVEVTIVEALPRLLAGEEPEISAAVERAFRKRGMTVRTGVGVEDVSTTDDGVRLLLADGGEIAGDLVLVAVGRGPVSDGLGYAEAGVVLERGLVVVDERLATSVPGVYAVGDLVAGPQLAHRGFAHGIFVAEEIAHRTGRWGTAAGAGPRPGSPAGDLQRPRGRLGGAERGGRPGGVRGRADADLRPGRQREVADPQDAGLREARTPGGRPGGGGAPGGLAGQRADRRGTAHHRLGRLPRRRRGPVARPPHPVRGPRRGPPRPRRQALHVHG